MGFEPMIRVLQTLALREAVSYLVSIYGESALAPFYAIRHSIYGSPQWMNDSAGPIQLPDLPRQVRNHEQRHDGSYADYGGQ